MREINLLAWRPVRRKQQERMLRKVCLLGLTIIGIIIGLMHSIFSVWLNNEDKQIKFWQARLMRQAREVNEIKLNQSQIQQFEAAFKEIKALTLQRTFLLNFIHQLLLEVPSDIYFSAFTRKQDQIILQGTASSASALALMVDKLNAAPHWHKARIVDLQNSNPPTQLNFQLQVIQDADASPTASF